MEAAKKIFCIGFALFKAIDKSMNDAHYTANGGSWGVATRVYTSNHQALHSYLPGAISKTSRLPEGYPKMTSQIWPAIKVALPQIFKLTVRQTSGASKNQIIKLFTLIYQGPFPKCTEIILY